MPIEPFSAFFRARNLEEVAWSGMTETTLEACAELQRMGWLPAEPTLREVVDTAYKALIRLTPSEYGYKNSLISKLVFGKYSPHTTSWYSELPIGEARADAVLINGRATVFEIKTELDDFSRADNQINEYYRCFQFLTFVVAPAHLAQAKHRLPPYVGIWTLTERSTLRIIREAEEYSGLLANESMFRLFRETERDRLALQLGVSVADAAPVDRYSEMRARVCAATEPEQLHRELVAALRARSPASARLRLTATLPVALLAAVYEYRLRAADWKRLAARIDERVDQR